MGFIDGDLFDGDSTAVGLICDDTVDKKEWITMWEDGHDFFDAVDCFPFDGRLREGFGGGGG